jgi:hypothetical protein
MFVQTCKLWISSSDQSPEEEFEGSFVSVEMFSSVNKKLLVTLSK